MHKDTIEKYIFRYLLALALFAIALGTVFYHLVEHLKWVDSYYFSVITLATVGYGDITPHTTAGKIFTTFYIFFGVGVLTTFLTYSLKRRGERFHDRRSRKNKR